MFKSLLLSTMLYRSKETMRAGFRKRNEIQAQRYPPVIPIIPITQEAKVGGSRVLS
jgi:hypothetical protein